MFAATSVPSTVTSPGAPVIDLVDPAGSISTAEAATHLEDREQAGLADIGPGAIGLAAAMDASTAHVLTRVRAGATAEALTGQDAGLDPFAPEPGVQLLAGLRDADLHARRLGPRPSLGTVDDAPETVEIAGNTGTITSSSTLRSSISGSLTDRTGPTVGAGPFPRGGSRRGRRSTPTSKRVRRRTRRYGRQRGARGPDLHRGAVDRRLERRPGEPAVRVRPVGAIEFAPSAGRLTTPAGRCCRSAGPRGSWSIVRIYRRRSTACAPTRLPAQSEPRPPTTERESYPSER